MRILPSFLILALSLSVHAQVAPLTPRDEGAGDPSFITFRARLVEIIARRDASAILNQFSSDAKLSFGDSGAGPAGVREMWFENGVPRDNFWAELGRIVALGSVRGSVDPNEDPAAGEAFFSAPYPFAAWPDSLDAFTHGAVIGENVRVRASQSLDSEILTRLTYSIVPVESWDHAEGGTGSGWVKIRVGEGQEGFVASRYVVSPIGYRAGFMKRNGSWTIVFFLAGD